MDDAADLAMIEEARIRPSISIRRAAEAVDCDISTIYRALKSGALQGHRLGTWRRRVFVDSLNAWQQSGMQTTPAPTSGQGRERSPAGRAHNHAAHKAALARLRADGFL